MTIEKELEFYRLAKEYLTLLQDSFRDARYRLKQLNAFYSSAGIIFLIGDFILLTWVVFILVSWSTFNYTSAVSWIPFAGLIVMGIMTLFVAHLTHIAQEGQVRATENILNINETLDKVEKEIEKLTLKLKTTIT